MVSIIIPVYNCEKYLNNQMNCVVNQTYKDLQILLIDDGSTDNSPSMCDIWAQQDSRITVIHKENGGASSAKNAGLKKSTGEYIVFIDADDELELNMIELMLKAISDADIVCCGYREIDFDGNESIWSHKNEHISNVEGLRKMLSDRSFLGILCNKMFKRSIVSDKNGELFRFDEDISFREDMLWLTKVLKNKGTVRCMEDVLYIWKKHKTGLSYTDRSLVKLDGIYAYDRMLAEIDGIDKTALTLLIRKNLYQAKSKLIDSYAAENDEYVSIMLDKSKTAIDMFVPENIKDKIFIAKYKIIIRLIKSNCSKALIEKIDGLSVTR